MCDAVTYLTAELKENFKDVSTEHEKLNKDNHLKSNIVSQLKGKIADLESELRAQEVQNFRLKRRIRVITEHTTKTENRARESAETFGELYQESIRKFEKLQEENDKIKSYVKKLEQELACKADDSKCCEQCQREYEKILDKYNEASANFVTTLNGYFEMIQNQNCNKCGTKAVLPPIPTPIFHPRTNFSARNDCNTCPLKTNSCAPSTNFCPLTRPSTSNSCAMACTPAPTSCAKRNTCNLNTTVAPPEPFECSLNSTKLDTLPDSAFVPHEVAGGCQAKTFATCNLSGGKEDGSKSSLAVRSDVSTRGSTQPATGALTAVTSSPSEPTFYDDVYENTPEANAPSCAKKETCALTPKKKKLVKNTRVPSCAKRNATEAVCDLSPARLATPRTDCSASRSVFEQMNVNRQPAQENYCPFMDRERNTPSQPICSRNDREMEEEEEVQDACGCAGRNTSTVQFRCNVCEEKSRETPDDCECGKRRRECDGGCSRVQAKESIMDTMNLPKKVLKRQCVREEDSEADLLEDMMRADQEDRLQRSAAPEPSAGRLNTAQGVVSYIEGMRARPASSDRSSMSVDGGQRRRKNSLPSIIQEKVSTVVGFIGDMIKTLATPNRANLEDYSVPEVKLRGTPTPRARVQCQR